MSLRGLQVLVTRPQGQGEALVAAIHAEGGQGRHYPVLAIQPLDAARDASHWQQCKQQIMALDQFQQVIFISTNAARYGLEWIDQYWPQLPVGIHWYGIGKATSAALQAAAVPIVTEWGDEDTAAPMNSEQLLRHPLLRQLALQKVLIVRGIGGRDYLAQQLGQRGAQVHYADCYRRALAEHPVGDVARVIDQQGINTLCVNSAESLQNLCQLAGEPAQARLRQLTLVVPGERVAAIASAAGFTRQVVAANASDQAILAALRSLASRVH